MPVLRIRNGPDKGKVHEITDAPLTIGRDASESIQILDQGASRQHAEVFRVGEMCFIRDLDSKNGVFVNDERITEELLQIGDKIRIGSTVFVFEEAGGSIEARGMSLPPSSMTKTYAASAPTASTASSQTLGRSSASCASTRSRRARS